MEFKDLENYIMQSVKNNSYYELTKRISYLIEDKLKKEGYDNLVVVGPYDDTIYIIYLEDNQHLKTIPMISVSIKSANADKKINDRLILKLDKIKITLKSKDNYKCDSIDEYINICRQILL